MGTFFYALGDTLHVLGIVVTITCQVEPDPGGHRIGRVGQASRTRHLSGAEKKPPLSIEEWWPSRNGARCLISIL
jgi:hypothetical protein